MTDPINGVPIPPKEEEEKDFESFVKDENDREQAENGSTERNEHGMDDMKPPSETKSNNSHTFSSVEPKQPLTFKEILRNVGKKLKDILVGAIGVAAGLGSRILLGREGYQKEMAKAENISKQETINEAKKPVSDEKNQPHQAPKEYPSSELPTERIKNNLERHYPNADISIQKSSDKERENLYKVSITDKSDKESKDVFYIDEKGEVVNDDKTLDTKAYSDVIEQSIDDQRLNNYLQATVGDATNKNVYVSRETEKIPPENELIVQIYDKQTKDIECIAYIDRNNNVRIAPDTPDAASKQSVINIAVNQYEINTNNPDLGLKSENIKEEIEKQIKTNGNYIMPTEQDAKVSYNGINYDIHCTNDGFLTIHGSMVLPNGDTHSVLSEGPVDVATTTVDDVTNTLKENVIHSVEQYSWIVDFTPEAGYEDTYQFDNGDNGDLYTEMDDVDVPADTIDDIDRKEAIRDEYMSNDTPEL